MTLTRLWNKLTRRNHWAQRRLNKLWIETQPGTVGEA